MALYCRTVFPCFTALRSRSFHASSSLNSEFKKLMFNLDGYNKYGLLKDDLLTDFYPEVAEAIRRLPEEEQLQRKYRAIRAVQADIKNTILPKEQWTKYEDNHHYLQPYIKEVLFEKQEQEEWEATH